MIMPEFDLDAALEVAGTRPACKNWGSSRLCVVDSWAWGGKGKVVAVCKVCEAANVVRQEFDYVLTSLEANREPLHAPMAEYCAARHCPFCGEDNAAWSMDVATFDVWPDEDGNLSTSGRNGVCCKTCDRQWWELYEYARI